MKLLCGRNQVKSFSKFSCEKSILKVTQSNLAIKGTKWCQNDLLKERTQDECGPWLEWENKRYQSKSYIRSKFMFF